MTERHFHNPNPILSRTTNATDSLHVNTAPRFDPANSKMIGEGIITRAAATTSTSSSMGRIGYCSSHNTAAAMPSILGQSAACSAGGLLGGRKAFPSASALNKKKTAAFGFEQDAAASAAFQTALKKTSSAFGFEQDSTFQGTKSAIAAPKILKIGASSGHGSDKSSKIDGGVRFAPLEKAVLFPQAQEDDDGAKGGEKRFGSAPETKHEIITVAPPGSGLLAAKRRRESSSDGEGQATCVGRPRTVRFDSPPLRAQPPPPPPEEEADGSAGRRGREVDAEPPQQKRRRYQRRNSKVSHMFFRHTPESLGLTEKEREGVERDMMGCGDASQQRSSSSFPTLPPSSHPEEEEPTQQTTLLSAHREHTKGRASSLPAGQPTDNFFRAAAERYHSFPPAQQPKRALAAPRPSPREDGQMPLLAQHELLRRTMRAQQERRRALLEMAVAASDGDGDGGGAEAAKFLS